MMKMRSQSGQVLLVGVMMMVILLLVILYAFDVHNVIRAKIKVETAQQAAAMSGAAWQKNSLNLIGELNLLKATALLLEGSENWQNTLPKQEEENEDEYRRAVQSRVDLLTEMQTRVSFIGPLIGFAAAQQTAKANGLNRVPYSGGAMKTYLELLRNDHRYIEELGGADRFINNYDWREPYIALVSAINDAGCAVFPNARTAGLPETYPRQLAYHAFYAEILKYANAVSSQDPPSRHFASMLSSIVRSMDDKDFQGKWWNINYDTNKFPNESEIFTIGVEFGDDYSDEDAVRMQIEAGSKLQTYQSHSHLPARMKWCRYDEWWYPDYYRNNYADYESSHFKYWFEADVLRFDVKPEYIYEGPAAYTEGMADVGSAVHIRPSTRTSYLGRRGAKDAVKSSSNPILTRRGQYSSRVGSKRAEADNSDVSTSYRPGSISKVLGSLLDNKPPIELPIILPVFKKVSPMPTFMPIPYGFQVLKPGYSDLERFLSWLSRQNDLNGIPPEGTEMYLEALQKLQNGIAERAKGNSSPKVPNAAGNHVAGRGLRYYAYNHKFNASAFKEQWQNRLYEWRDQRDKLVFQQKLLDGPGYLQEPQLFSNQPLLRRYTIEETDKNGRKIKKVVCGVIKPNSTAADPPYICDEVTHKVAMPDNINGGTAYRVYVNLPKSITVSSKGSTSTSYYYVIDSRGRIVTSGQPDPTILYNQSGGGGGGGQYSDWAPGSFDSQRGPARL